MNQMRKRMMRRAKRQAGMTLMEIMIVLVIVGMLATGIGVAVMPMLERARVRDTAKAVQVVKSAVNMYRLDNPRACPDVNELIRSKYLDGSKSAVDAWGNDFIIQCERGEIIVVSPGPDGQTGTEDDIR
ncbi:MAG: prepilin-type N-terminal cleavage/methylation domain-containing protein [Myxococcales bacterium]|jgi:general secretion pathway protein G|nr:prepilin-type N-terminal cleavage/methylation domain-containing protein [Myxococcales bacterium]